jgi:glutamate 5-kinase
MSKSIAGTKRIVVKVGSTLVTNNGAGLDRQAIAMWAEQVSALLKQGCQVLMVSSGAIAEGMQRLEDQPPSRDSSIASCCCSWANGTGASL